MPARRGGGSDQRGAPRQPLHVSAALLVYRARHDVRIVDISSGGAMVVAVAADAALPGVGDEVVLAREGFQAVATIIWVKAGNAGIAFHRAIDVAATIRRFAADETPDEA